MPLSQAQGTRLLSDTEIAALIAQGDRLLNIGDVASARLFYERAADAANGKAALKLAITFDPAFLRFSARLSTVRGDSITAAAWYRRARDLGEVEAEIPLKRLDQGFP
jgi:TPR repeat protein